MDGQAYINENLFDFDNAIREFRFKKFERYDSEWLHFIVDSRDGLRVWKDYDIIEGGGPTIVSSTPWKLSRPGR